MVAEGADVQAFMSWRVLGASVTGAAHKRTNTPNQDALYCWRSADEAPSALIVAVSDGHGSPFSIRSDIGAHLAVRAGIDAGRETIQDQATFTAESIATVPRRIVEQWRSPVAQVEGGKGAVARRPLGPVMAGGRRVGEEGIEGRSGPGAEHR